MDLFFTLLIVGAAGGYLMYLTARKVMGWKQGSCGGCSSSKPAPPLITTLTVKPRRT